MLNLKTPQMVGIEMSKVIELARHLGIRSGIRNINTKKQNLTPRQSPFFALIPSYGAPYHGEGASTQALEVKSP